MAAVCPSCETVIRLDAAKRDGNSFWCEACREFVAPVPQRKPPTRPAVAAATVVEAKPEPFEEPESFITAALRVFGWIVFCFGGLLVFVSPVVGASLVGVSFSMVALAELRHCREYLGVIARRGR